MPNNHRRPSEQNNRLHGYSVKCYAPTSFGQYAERYGTLRASGGDLGGGGGDAHYLLYQQTIGSLCQDDYKGPNRQYADQDKLIIEVCEVITR